ncbi:MAG TPA: hypothetical protein VIF40_12890 [Methylosinus sp.]|jgi:hypothetical protein|uniref:hypothetical protein n=1 Tax=Methylosinus sp. TaxID=427 RepID=UPI002F952CE8
MRRIVRPFVKEFKSRSAKAAAGRLPLLEETTAAEPKPAFLDLASFAPRVVERETHHDDTYEAAMKAADLVFGKKIEPAADAPLATTGRVLPSLVEIAAPQPELLEEPVRRKRGRPPGVKKAAEPVSKAEAPIRRPRRAPKEAAPEITPALALVPAPAPPPRRSPAPSPVAVMAQPAVSVAVAAEVATTGRRVRRSIQLRWVLGTELQAGERWKRRLPQAAR